MTPDVPVETDGRELVVTACEAGGCPAALDLVLEPAASASPGAHVG
jgi:hypothetical protein